MQTLVTRFSPVATRIIRRKVKPTERNSIKIRRQAKVERLVVNQSRYIVITEPYHKHTDREVLITGSAQPLLRGTLCVMRGVQFTYL